MAAPTKVCLITGGGTGIGLATALALADEGYALVLAGRRADGLQDAAREVSQKGAAVLAVPTDVSQSAAVRELFAKTRDAFGHLDLLFNNAGINTPPTPLEELTLEQWQAVVNVNLTGVFLCTQEAFRMMKQQDPQGGRIINNGSISAHVPRPLAVAYNATKHAVTGLTKSTSLEGRAYNIACGQIDIGNARTELAAAIQTQGALQPDGSRRVEPSMDALHVARAIVYMASLPLDANVQFMTVMATGMPYIGRG
jgi:NAD(P)-dependent dehydrogenase (short-subunit alcohol dehydrogenase family)